MLSWKLWRLRYYIPNQWRFERTLLLGDDIYHIPIPQPSILLVAWMCACMALPFILIPLTITYFCTRLAWRTTLVLARLHELGRYEHLAVTPIGQWGVCLFIGQRYADHIKDTAFSLFVVALVMSSVFVIFVGLTTFGESRRVALLLLVLIECALAATVYLDFNQALSASFLIAAAASTTKERTTAGVMTIAACVGMQLAAYALWYAVFLATNYFVYNATRVLLIREGSAAIAICVATGVLCLAREALVYGLWRWLGRRINDLPVLKQA